MKSNYEIKKEQELYKYERDVIATKLITCLEGRTFQEVIDLLEYAKDFLHTRCTLQGFASSNIIEEYEKQKKLLMPGISSGKEVKKWS